MSVQQQNSNRQDHRMKLLRAALRDSDREGPICTHSCLTGHSGAKVVGLLQRLAKCIHGDPDVCYLEVGVFQGLTLLSVASMVPTLQCYGIDNFSQFDPKGENKNMVLERQQILQCRNVEILDLDYEDALIRFGELSGGRKIGLLFVDGPHDYRSQLMCVLLALPFLADWAVIVIDDCNYEHVRLSTRDLLCMLPEFRMVFEAYTPTHPSHMDSVTIQAARDGWWNGIHVLVREKGAQQVSPLPSVGSAKQRSLLEHKLQPHAVADISLELADQAYDLARGVSAKKLWSAIQLLRRIRKHVNKPEIFRYQNMASANLSSVRNYLED